MVNSYAVARPRAKKPIKPRPNNSIAYVSGSGTTDPTAASCPWLLMAVARKVSNISRQVHHGAKIGHACAIRAGDEGMDLPVVSLGFPYHLPRVVDPVSPAIVSTECAEIGHAYAIRARDEGMVLPLAVRIPLPPAPRR